MAGMSGFVAMSLDEVWTLSRTVLRRYGLAEDHVEAVAAVIVAGERDGCTSHGVYRLLDCARSLKSGVARPDAVPVVSEPAPALVRVDAASGFAPLAYRRGLPHLVDKARRLGIAAMAINDCVHFAALWPDVEPLAEQGLVGLAVTPSVAWVAPAGGTRPLLGTNPMAFSWPRPDGKAPFTIDLATSAVPRGEVDLRRRQGVPLEPGWAIDAEGKPTTDAAAAMDGAILTFGGHKGSALSIMVELLGGPLIGDLTSREALAHDAGRNGSPYGGELILAIDPARFLGDGLAANLLRAEGLFDAITGQGARLPSARRHVARRRSLAEGVRIETGLHTSLMALLDD